MCKMKSRSVSRVQPMTEFANVWVSQHSGTQQIQLAPSSECSAICRPVSALLRPGETREWTATTRMEMSRGVVTSNRFNWWCWITPNLDQEMDKIREIHIFSKEL